MEGKDIHMNNHLVENIMKTKIEAEEYKKEERVKKKTDDILEEEVRQI